MRIIAGTYKNRYLNAPKGEQTRPTSSLVRESVFNIVQNRIVGAVFLDLFAGSGGIGIEALSRGAQFVTFVDQSIEAIKSIQRNLETLEIKEHCKVLRGEVLKILKGESKHYDIVYADPPYALDFLHPLLSFFDQSALLKPGGDLFIEQGLQKRGESFDYPTLTLKSSRKLGTTLLYHFEKLNHA